MDVGLFEEKLDDILVPVLRCHPERRAVRSRRVGAGVRSEEQGDHGGVAVARSDPQRRAAAGLRDVRAGADPEQKGDDGRVVAHGGEEQRRGAVFGLGVEHREGKSKCRWGGVRRVEGGEGGPDELHQREMTGACCSVKRCLVVEEGPATFATERKNAM